MTASLVFGSIAHILSLPSIPGPNPVATESQNRAIDKLNTKLFSRNSTKAKKDKDGEEEESITFDLKSTTRVILFEGKVFKRSEHKKP